MIPSLFCNRCIEICNDVHTRVMIHRTRRKPGMSLWVPMNRFVNATLCAVQMICRFRGFNLSDELAAEICSAM